MYTRILVAVDNTEISELVMREALKLTQGHSQAKLHIIYVADAFVPIAEGVHINFKKHEESIRKQGTSILKKMIHLAQKENVTAESSLIEITESNANIAKKIVNAAQDWQADLIVLGTHGRKGLPRFLLGSVTEEVMRNTTIPVHVIRCKE